MLLVMSLRDPPSANSCWPPGLQIYSHTCLAAPSTQSPGSDLALVLDSPSIALPVLDRHDSPASFSTHLFKSSCPPCPEKSFFAFNPLSLSSRLSVSPPVHLCVFPCFLVFEARSHGVVEAYRFFLLPQPPFFFHVFFFSLVFPFSSSFFFLFLFFLRQDLTVHPGPDPPGSASKVASSFFKNVTFIF